MAALEADSKKVGTQGGDIDFALLVDGLAAEREQGITIDVAYRFFSTDTRKFIVADTPGHEQYTRNMSDRGVHGGRGGDPDRRAQGRAGADAPAQLPGLAAGHQEGHPGHQQDGCGGVRAECLRCHPRGLPEVRGADRAYGHSADPDVGAQGRQRHRVHAQHGVVQRSDLDAAPGGHPAR